MRRSEERRMGRRAPAKRGEWSGGGEEERKTTRCAGREKDYAMRGPEMACASRGGRSLLGEESSPKPRPAPWPCRGWLLPPGSTMRYMSAALLHTAGVLETIGTWKSGTVCSNAAFLPFDATRSSYIAAAIMQHCQMPHWPRTSCSMTNQPPLWFGEQNSTERAAVRSHLAASSLTETEHRTRRGSGGKDQIRARPLT
eukprot:2472179-Rhodomonas_salina.1